MRRLSTLLLLLSVAACSGPTVVVDDTPVEPSASAQELFEEAGVLWESSAQPDFEQIADLLEDATDQDSQYTDAWFNLGVAYDALSREEDAISAYEQASTVDPTHADARTNIAVLLLNQGRMSEGERMLLDVVEGEQFYSHANLNLAQLHRDRARLENGGVDTNEADQAINRVRMALAGDATNVHAYETLASVYFDLGRFELAKLVCLNAIAMEVESGSLHNRLGLIALAQDDVTAAYAEFHAAVNLDPKLIAAAMNLGAIALSYRDYEGAVESFDLVLAVDSEHIEALISHSVALRGLELYDEAEQGYLRVLSLDDENLAALYNLGVLYQEHLQDYETAVTWFERYLRADLGAESDLFEDVEVRLNSLRELIQWLREAEAVEPATVTDEGGGGETDAWEEDQSVDEPIEEEGVPDEPAEESAPEPEGSEVGESDEVL